MAKMKFENGKGSVTKLSGKRRKPYLVRSGASYNITEDGQLKENRKVIGYAATKEEAFRMLTDFISNPYDLSKTKVTFKQLYEEWHPSYFQGVSDSTKSFYRTAFSHCEAIYDKPIKELRLIDYQRMFDEATDKKGNLLSQDSLKNIKIFLGVMNKYALKNEIITKDYSKDVDIKRYKDREGKKIDRNAFTDREIFTLWTKQNDKTAQILLCMIYTGLRVKKEFFNVKKADVNLEDHYLNVTESKTKNGIRWLPIPDVIYPIVCDWYNDGDSEYLFHTERGNRIDYNNFLKYNWNPIMKDLNMEHTPYDCRHTYNSLLANLQIHKDIRETLMGQSSGSVNVEVYTHYKMEVLLDIVNRLTKPNENAREIKQFAVYNA